MDNNKRGQKQESSNTHQAGLTTIAQYNTTATVVGMTMIQRKRLCNAIFRNNPPKLHSNQIKKSAIKDVFHL